MMGVHMSSKGRKRRRFTPEFKADAVKLVQRGERSIREIARDLGISAVAVRLLRFMPGCLDDGRNHVGQPRAILRAMPLERLRPTTKPRVIDLVEQAGLDIAKWSYRADGSPVETPAANPAYCYEWCFEESGKIVFNLWFANMSIENGRVVQRVNMRKLRRRIEAAKHIDKGAQTAMVKRAVAVDLAVQHGFRDKTPVRVIVCDGERRDLDDPASVDPSRVELRFLDPSPWHVAEYDYRGATTGGDAVVVRDEVLVLETP